MAPVTFFTFVCLLPVMLAKGSPIHEQVETLDAGKTPTDHRLELLEEQMRQVLSALEAIKLDHGKQIVHNDLSNATAELNTEKEMEQRLHKCEEKMQEDYGMFVDMYKAIEFNKEERLILLSKSGNTAGVKFLLDLGADTEAKDGQGKTALHIAAEAGHVGVVGVLVDSGAYVNARDDDNNTPLLLAAENGQVEVCKLLIQSKARVNWGNKEGWTALHRAASKGQTEVCRLLLDSGAQVNQLTDANNTPLHYAAWNGHLSTVKLLIQFNADTSLKADDEHTPLDDALSRGHTEVADYLREVSANN